MHDVVHRDVLSIASNSKDGFLVRCRVHLEGWPNLLRQPYESSTLTISETELLLLSCTEGSETTPPALILNGIQDLKVLDIRRADMSSILLSIVLLKSLQTLHLEHFNLESVHVDIGELQELMILSFCGSAIKQLPAGIEKLPNLRLLDVTECKSPQSNIMNVTFVPSLAKLDELNDSSNERQFAVLHNMLLFHQLQRFKISTAEMDDMLSNPNPYENYLRIDLDADSRLGSRINVLLKRTNTLVLNLFRLRDALNLLDTECCVNLKSLELNHCHALEYVIDMTDIDPCIVFLVLKSLTIQGAEMLKEICIGEDLLPMGSLKKLSKLSLSNIPSLTNFGR
ncbi:uncharacterized protein LOC133737673 [Rosa rugosa]|uniref:uncharacterized protein LOC133737673 n=1 Tax=Rosa rugosa TaxID=74645 RepID=UPI002B4005A5|nr:uncharacterized protein LOC133737673 [Rosa rugosa]